MKLKMMNKTTFWVCMITTVVVMLGNMLTDCDLAFLCYVLSACFLYCSYTTYKPIRPNWRGQMPPKFFLDGHLEQYRKVTFCLFVGLWIVGLIVGIIEMEWMSHHMWD